MSAFTGEFKLSVGIAIKTCTECNKVTDAGGTFFDQHAHGIDIAKTCTGRQRVGQMQIGGIRVTTENRGHAALGPPSGGLLKRTFCQNANANSGLSSCPHCCRKPSDAGTHYEKIEFSVHRPSV
jgi:hypothetical protein